MIQTKMQIMERDTGRSGANHTSNLMSVINFVCIFLFLENSSSDFLYPVLRLKVIVMKIVM